MPVAEDKRQIRELIANSRARASRDVLYLWHGIATVLRCFVMALVGLLLPLAVSRPLLAQSLGDEVILSRLGDPVEIEIALKDWQHLDMPKVKVTNATPEQYASFKLTYLPLLESLNFNVVGPNSAGEVKILVSSRKPVAEPYMDLLLVMRWPEGSAMREYVLLFDPPLPNFSGAGEQKPRSKPVTDKAAPAPDKPQVAIAVADPAPKEQSNPRPAKPVVESTLDTRQQPKPEPRVESRPEPKVEVKPESRVEPKSEPKVEAKLETKVEPKPEPKVETKPEPRVEPKSEPKVEPKPEARVEPKPEPKVEPRPKERAAKAVTATQQPDVRTQTAIEVEKISPTVAVPVDDGRRQYRVRNGDSLWIIARQFHPAGIGENIYQFLISLHDLNRDAFINGNISLLKADAQLHIPSARDIATINPGSAQKIFDQLWRDGVRSPDLVAGVDAPQFKPLNEADVPKPQPVLPATAKLPPGIEKQDKVVPSSSPLLAAATGTIPAVANQSPPVPGANTVTESAPTAALQGPTIQVIPQQAVPAKSAAVVADDGNPFMNKINESAANIKEMLEARRQRLVALEQQILAMQTQLQQAESRASELGPSIEQKRAEVTNKAIQLGLLAALLLILLGTTVHYALKWNRDIQRQQKLRK